jgi:2-oxoglutarate dehydrogenase E2 component (dihydrolipoamide succinyltransferase)
MSETDITVTVPSLGEHVTEAVITRWLVTQGDSVDEGTPLLEVATDKVDTEIPSPHSGTILSIHASEDDVVALGAPLVTIAATRLESPLDAPPAPSSTFNELDSSVPGPSRQEANSAETVTVSPQAHGDGADAPKAATTVERLPRIRQTIARRMLESLHNSAQLTTVIEVDVTGITNLRAANKARFQQETGTNLTFLPFFSRAAVEALAAHPTIGASVNADCTEITLHHFVNLGIAVDGPKGLIVPVVRGADQLGIAELATQIDDLARQVRAGQIRPDSLTGGTFTITNTGSRGALFDTPIINQPQSAILGTGSVVERVVPFRDIDGAVGVRVRSMAYLSLSYDHRVVDGADAARFLGAMKDRLENSFTEEELFERDSGRSRKAVV